MAEGGHFWMRSCCECWVRRDDVEKEWGSGRGLSQHSFFCAGKEDALSKTGRTRVEWRRGTKGDQEAKLARQRL